MNEQGGRSPATGGSSDIMMLTEMLKEVILSKKDNDFDFIEKPRKYDGFRDPHVIEAWIQSVEDYADLKGLDTKKMAKLGVALLSGAAKVWLQNLRLLDSASSEWLEFKTELRAYFKPESSMSVARDKILKQYMHKIRSKHMFTSAFHSRTNSKCERLNQTFKHMLTKYVKGLVHSWDDYVDSPLFSCRVRRHATSGYSPFYSVCGQEPVLPGDSRRPFMDPLTEEDPELIIAEDVLDRIRDLKEKRFEAKKQIILQARKDKERWDAALNNRLVYYAFEGLQKKNMD